MRKPCNGCQFALECSTKKATRYYPNNRECLGCEKYIAYCEYRKSKQKFHKGKQILTMTEFDKHIPDRFMYWRHKIQHIGWLTSMQYRSLKNAVESGYIYEAIKRKDYED